jgi:GT2 family glycosyltransferase
VNDPELSVVVFSYRNEDTVLDAVDSLLGQDEPVEIVVSHSGGGPTPGLLAARPGLRVVASPGRLLPGAARNAGVANTRAPLVAFLEADCTAEPGWVAHRLRHHRRGAPAVASAVMPHRDTWITRAAWLNEHSPRIPTARPVYGALHGVSYTREALERFGPFREDVATGEDTLVNYAMVAAGVEVVWEPLIVSRHRYPESVRAAVLDAYRRGRRRNANRRDLGYSRRRLLRRVVTAPRRGARRGLGPVGPLTERQVLTSLPLMMVCALAKAAGLAGAMARER